MDGFVATKPTNGSITLSTQTIMIGQASLDFNLYGIRLRMEPMNLGFPNGSS
jgi:hypothetical protein